ncbi:MAG: YjjG family noncanonical pyrimidine nucleotidase [Hyphomicrobiales bacterium]
MKRYKHLFFDLDRTLWDFEQNALDTLEGIYTKNELKGKGVSCFNDFFEVYRKHNTILWKLYREEKIKKEHLKNQRFYLTLKEFGVDDPILANEIGDDYITISPTKTKLFPNAIEILEYLYPKYQMHIITNGFKEVQLKKLVNSKLYKYFDKIITSEEAGCKKPDRRIFEYSMNATKAENTDSLMIGDDFEIDILGAASVNMDQAFFNPNNEEIDFRPTFEVKDLIQLKEILS